MNLRRSVLLAAVGLCLTLSAARAQDVLRVVTDATFPPMEFVKDGKRTGFDIELTEALAVAMGRKIEWVDSDFKGLIPALVAKQTRQRAGRHQVGGLPEGELPEGRAHQGREEPGDVQPGRDRPGRCGGDGQAGREIFTQAKPMLHVLAEQLTIEDYVIAVRKDAPEIRHAVNAALKKIRADGSYEKLVNKWFEAGK